MKGGSPTNPQLVSQFKYDLNAVYARVWQLLVRDFARHTHGMASGPVCVCGGRSVRGASLQGAPGRQQSDFRQTARHRRLGHHEAAGSRLYEPTDGGVHNVWVVGDTLYLGNYQAARGRRYLRGVEGRSAARRARNELDSDGRFAGASAGAVCVGGGCSGGNIFVTDINTGLWILRMEPKQQPIP